MAKVMGNRIQVYRKQYNMRQQTLADQLGINRTYLSKLENYVHNPSPELMIRLCEVFECDLGDMFTVEHK
ncbi:MAG: helix-turn-helix transcriptional regulator [Clostridia bacterium]|nr:helix-turn-helix transcriptional regulator [Clostridia bacterium]